MSNVLTTLNMQIEQLVANTRQVKEDLAKTEKMLGEFQEVDVALAEMKKLLCEMHETVRYIDSIRSVSLRPTCYCQFGNDESDESDEFEFDGNGNCESEAAKDCGKVWRCSTCGTGTPAYCHCDEISLFTELENDDSTSDDDLNDSDSTDLKEHRSTRLYKSKCRTASRRLSLYKRVRRVSHGAQHRFKLERTQYSRRRRANLKSESSK